MIGQKTRWFLAIACLTEHLTNTEAAQEVDKERKAALQRRPSSQPPRRLELSEAKMFQDIICCPLNPLGVWFLIIDQLESSLATKLALALWNRLKHCKEWENENTGYFQDKARIEDWPELRVGRSIGRGTLKTCAEPEVLSLGWAKTVSTIQKRRRAFTAVLMLLLLVHVVFVVECCGCAASAVARHRSGNTCRLCPKSSSFWALRPGF